MPRRRSEVWAADCETDPFKIGRIPKPFIWGAYEIYSRRYECFGSSATLCNFFRERKCTVYFHNGGKFDLHYLRPEFNSDENILLINGRITRARVGTAEFRDSFALIPVSLAKYQKEEFDYSILEEDVRGLPENVVKIERYLKSDCVNLGSMLLDFFERYGKGLTQAGVAMNYWAKHYNDGKKPRQTAAQFERYRPYYYGGRVECFASGYKECEFKIADKNSAYPDAMRAQHPISTEAIQLSKLPKDSLISQCFIHLRGRSHGALPYRAESGELVFPRDGVLRTYQITGWELIAALEENSLEIEAVLDCHYFRETVSFAEYIDYFYQQRIIAKANGDKAGDLFSKLFMNSCYGGFAMNPDNYHEYMLASQEKLSEHLSEGYREYHPWGDGRHLLWRKLSVETQQRMYKNIATAASITGHVRASLFRDLQKVRHPIYCDTDSISAIDVSGLELGRELGQWKLEAECTAYAIAGKKLYAMRTREGEYKLACKGVNLTADEIISIAKGATVKYTPSVPTYSITRAEPRFIDRDVRLTAKIQHAA
jgi:Vibrio phage DNA polymerase